MTITPPLAMVKGIERIQSVRQVGFSDRAPALKDDPSKSEMASGHMAGSSSSFLYMTISLSSVCWCCVRGARSWLCSSSKGIENTAWAGIFLRPRLAEGTVDEATLLLPFCFLFCL